MSNFFQIAISVRNLSKAYYHYPRPADRLKQAFWGATRQFYSEFWALKNVAFDVWRGTTVGIIGRNGSGKSTLLQIVAHTLYPTAGDVKVNGRVLSLLELGAGFNPEFTGRENVLLNGAILGITRREMESRFERIAAFADIGEFMERPVKTYSTGMFLRLAFAIFTAIEADILLIDEVLAVGDEKFQRKCYNWLEEFRRSGGTVLLVSHDTTAVAQICDHVLMLDTGRLIGQGPPKPVIDAYHELLYDTESSYLSILNEPPAEMGQPRAGAGLSARNGGASIENIRMTKDGEEDECCFFGSGDAAVIRYDVAFFSDFPQVTAGIRIRTLQGVEVYGTSTSYHFPIDNIRSGERMRLAFRLQLDLCPGTYAVNCAVAERLGSHDMRYLDKHTDVVLFKVIPRGRSATGIANLKAEILVSREG